VVSWLVAAEIFRVGQLPATGRNAADWAGAHPGVIAGGANAMAPQGRDALSCGAWL